MHHTKLFPVGLTRGLWVMDDRPNGCDSSQGGEGERGIKYFLFFFFDFWFLIFALFIFPGLVFLPRLPKVGPTVLLPPLFLLFPFFFLLFYSLWP